MLPLSSLLGLFKNKTIGFIFLFEMMGLASFLAHLFVFSFKNETIVLFFSLFVIIFIVLSLGLSKIIDIYAGFLAASTSENKSLLVRELILTLLPFNFCYLIFLQHLFSLRDLTAALALLTCAGFLYHQFLFTLKLAKKHEGIPFFRKILAIFKLDFLSRGKTVILTLIIPVLLFVFLGSGLILPKHPLTGDEPHYLLITKSILSDGDINLYNNYSNEDYLEFYPGPLKSHARAGKKGDLYQYSSHSPGLPLLLVPFYFVGEKIGSLLNPDGSNSAIAIQSIVFFTRLPMNILAAILGWLLFLLAFQLTGERKLALLAWFIFCFTAPMVFYSQLIYPEIPAALLCILIFKQVVLKRSFSISSSFLMGLGLSLLPWLNPKYSVLALGLFALFFVFFFRTDKKGFKPIFSFLLPVVVSAGLYLLYLWILYGSVSPSSFYEFTDPDKKIFFSMFFHLNPLEFFRCALGYLFDQRFGLFPLSLVYILFIPGIFIFYKKDKKTATPLLLLLGLYWAFCSLSYYWGGVLSTWKNPSTSSLDYVSFCCCRFFDLTAKIFTDHQTVYVVSEPGGNICSGPDSQFSLS